MLALEKHYRVGELAKLWGFAASTVIRLFAAEPGVVRIWSPSGRRKYVTLSIPESVALRVHERLTQQLIDDKRLASQPLRVVRLRAAPAVVQPPRRTIRLRAGRGSEIPSYDPPA